MERISTPSSAASASVSPDPSVVASPTVASSSSTTVKKSKKTKKRTYLDGFPYNRNRYSRIRFKGFFAYYTCYSVFVGVVGLLFMAILLCLHFLAMLMVRQRSHLRLLHQLEPWKQTGVTAYEILGTIIIGKINRIIRLNPRIIIPPRIVTILWSIFVLITVKLIQQSGSI